MTAFLDLLEEDDRRRLLGAARSWTFAPGEQLIGEGARDVRLIVVRSGRARIEKDHLGGRVPIGHLGAGEVLGELSFLDRLPASANVVADTEIEADILDAEDVDRLLADDVALAAHVHRAMAITIAGRLRKMDAARTALPPVLGVG
jgi:CRP-like cAMP-binding protein